MRTFPAPADGPILVVGGGTAGCVVARRLTDAGHEVVLIEAGPGGLSSSDDRLSSLDHLRAHTAEHRWWSGVMARRTADGAATPYLLGRGLGGSSAVNGLMAEIDADDPALGAQSEVRRAIERQLVPGEPARPEELGPLNAALLESGVARPARLARRGGTRVDAGVAYLADLVESAGEGGAPLEVLADTTVDRVLDGEDRAAVVTSDGDRIDGRAVVLCAGAIHTPAILLRSQTTARPFGAGAIGHRVQDHPSVAVHVTLRPDVGATTAPLVTGVIAERGGVELVPLERLGGDPGAAVLVALLRPSGAAGTVRLRSDDPLDPPLVDLRSLEDPDDRRRLRDGVSWALETLADPQVAPVVDRVAIGHAGELSGGAVDDASIEEWLMTSTGAHHHVAASCGLGRCLDDDARVLGSASIHVVDASAFPVIPRTGTHLPTIVLAERLTQRWSA